MYKNSKPFRNIVSKLSKWGLIILLITLFTTLQPAPAAHAATITVTTTADEFNTLPDTGCSLREAIQAANTDAAFGGCSAGSGDDIITFSSAGTTLSRTGVETPVNNNEFGDLDINSNITISGNGAGVTIIDGDDIDRVLHTHGTSMVNLTNLTIRNGQVGTVAGADSGNGGGIYRESSGDMALSHVSILNNEAGHRGGGLENGNAVGTLTLTNCTVSENESRWGGGLVSATTGAETEIYNSTFSNNIAHTRGSGLNIYDGIITVESSTFANNSGAGSGGGLASQGTLNITNSTISGNTTDDDGGGIYRYGGTINVYNSTITDNTADNDNTGGGNGGGISGAVNIENSIVVGNHNNSAAADDDCINGTVSLGHNLVGVGTGCPTGGTGDLTTNTPLLSALADNGGPTKTHALLVGSPAIDVIPSASCASAPDNIDQRGALHNYDGNNSPSTDECDIGAYEIRESITVGTCSGSLLNGSQTFALAGGTVTIGVDSGDNITCITVEEMGTNHLMATGPGTSDDALLTNNWWHITGDITTGFNVDITLPYISADGDSRVCKWPGNLGGYGWDCDDGTNTTFVSGYVTRNNVTGFSDWAVGDTVGPTAVSLQSITTTSQPTGWVVLLFGALLLTMGGLWLRRVKQ